MRFAVIPSRGRPCLRDSVAAISDQVDHTFVLLNHCDLPELYVDIASINVSVDVFGSAAPVNLSALWNAGIRMASNRAIVSEVGVWDTAVINDDAIVPPGWVERVSTAMRDNGCAAGCTRSGLSNPIIHRQPGPVNLFTRMSGWAFVLRGELELYADERFTYWYGDDDLGWRAAETGGMIALPGGDVPNLYPNGQVTPELQEQISRDRIEFGEKWGKFPW